MKYKIKESEDGKGINLDNEGGFDNISSMT